MAFIDQEGCIIVPRSIRPIIEYDETFLGTKKGARRQFRHNTLHIREYDNHYTLHADAINPVKDPIGHLVLDAPEYLIGIISILCLKKQAQYLLEKKEKSEDKNQRNGILDKIIGICIAGSAAACLHHLLSYKRDYC